MVAYNFKYQFVPLVRDYVKLQTIRADRKRHARVGEPIQLYCHQRHPKCFKIITDPICSAIHRVHMGVGSDGFYSITVNGEAIENYDGFARADGFRDIEAMWSFWFKSHGPIMFTGVLIEWVPAKKPIALAA